MNEAVMTYCEHTLHEVNSIGKLQEWIEGLPLAQALGGRDDIPVAPSEAEQTVTFIGGETGADKNAVWEGAIRWAASTIYARASYAAKIVWRVKPTFSTFVLEDCEMPEKLRAILADRGHDFCVQCYLRAAFIEEK